MKSVEVQARQTKYCQAIERILPLLGHATNTELLNIMRMQFPGLSATTVHRATARLAERGVIALAPPAKDGTMRYDATITPHDHFMCDSCGLLRDTSVKEKVIPILEESMEGCRISGQLTISGTCKSCVSNVTDLGVKSNVQKLGTQVIK